MTVRLVPLLACSAALALAAACGGSSNEGPVAPGASGPTPGPSPTAAAALTLEQAKAVAAAGLVTAAELPGYKGVAQTTGADDAKFDDQVNTCIGLTPDADFLYSDKGTAFTSADEVVEVDTNVDVTKTRADADKDLAAVTSAKAVTCVQTAFRAALAGEQGVTIKDISITPVKDVPQGFGYQLAATVAGQGLTVAVKGYLLGAITGQAEIGLTTTGTNGSPLPLDKALALLTAATERATAAQA